MVTMLFKKGGKKLRGRILLPLILLLITGCFRHFEFDTTPLNLPEYTGFVFSLSSEYITVIDLERDAIIDTIETDEVAFWRIRLKESK